MDRLDVHGLAPLHHAVEADDENLIEELLNQKAGM